MNNSDWNYGREQAHLFSVNGLYVDDPYVTVTVWKITKEWNEDERSWRTRYGYEIHTDIGSIGAVCMSLIITGDDLRSPALYGVSQEPTEAPLEVAKTVASFLSAYGEHFTNLANGPFETHACAEGWCDDYTPTQHDWLADNYERLSDFALDSED